MEPVFKYKQLWCSNKYDKTINKQKRIPNTRQATIKHIGGQSGHIKHKLENSSVKENRKYSNLTDLK